jgi:hypothetical protein
MTELFMMAVLAGTVISAAAFTKSLEDQVAARIPIRNMRRQVTREIGETMGVYWGWPIL